MCGLVCVCCGGYYCGCNVVVVYGGVTNVVGIIWVVMIWVVVIWVFWMLL